LLKKIRIKPPEILAKAIALEDIEKLLAVIDNIRDRTMILLLLVVDYNSSSESGGEFLT
jgi:hypothetical protein